MRYPRQVLSVLSFFVLLLAAGVGFAGDTNQWELIDQQDGIRTWKLEVPGKDLPGFRGQTVIKAPVSAVYDTLMDRAKHTEWMHRCAESSLLKKLSDTQAILYNRTDAPWPIWDRDVILHSVITKSEDMRNVAIEFKGVGDHENLKPTPSRVIRMPKLEGYYKLIEQAPNETQVTYQVESDIGGSIPAWIARRASKELPYTTLSKLRQRVEKR